MSLLPAFTLQAPQSRDEHGRVDVGDGGVLLPFLPFYVYDPINDDACDDAHEHEYAPFLQQVELWVQHDSADANEAYLV